jgi:dipeptidyl aminopeptidase/acylaminoacyl peptidase
MPKPLGILARPLARSTMVVAALFLICTSRPASSHATQAPPAPRNTPVQRFADITISPTGDYLAWVGPPGGGAGATDGVVIVDLRRTNRPRHVLAVPGADAGSAHDLTWSADGKALAFIATQRNGRQPALYLAEATATAARLISRVPGAVSNPRFSPDGRELAFLYSTPAEQANGPLDAAPRDTGLIGSRVDRQHLALVSAGGGRPRQITSPDLYVYEFDWAPDGRQLVLSAARGSGNNNWWVARLYAVSLSGDLREVARPTAQIAEPRWSPDGKTIAYIGGLMSDQGVTGGDVWAVPIDGGEPRNLTEGATISAASFKWTEGSRSLLVAAWSRGGSAIAEVDAEAGGMRPLWSGDEWASTGANAWGPGFSATRDGRTVALVRESLENPPEVWSGPVGSWTQLTHVNQSVAPSAGKAVTLTWKSDSFDVQGWLVHPTNEVAGRRYPMIVDVHGGPAYASGPEWRSPGSQVAAFSRAGYFVLLPNPRGSFGQGEKFTRANVKDFGYGDLRDILAGVDAVVQAFPVDSQRVGITGWSYGGFMSMWAVTQTRRFRAAVAGAGLSNWLSYTGENGISEWMVPYFGATVYDDPAVYAKSSPINFITHARTPTLVVVGERDVECPAPQSFEFWRGLQRAGVPSQLVVYPDEGHGFQNPDHERDVNRRTLQWFDRYLAGETIP